MINENPPRPDDPLVPIRSHLDDFLYQVLLDLLNSDIWRVLDGDDNRVHAHGDHLSLFDSVLHCDLVRRVGWEGEEEGWE